MVFNPTFNNITAISWQSVLLVEKTGVHRENWSTQRKLEYTEKTADLSQVNDNFIT